MDDKPPKAPHETFPAVLAVPAVEETDANPGGQHAREGQPTTKPPWSLFEDVLSDLVRTSPQGSTVEWWRLERSLPEYGAAYPLLFPTDELAKYLEDDFQGILKAPVPKSIVALRRILIDIVPKRVGRFPVDSGIYQEMPPHAEVREVRIFPNQPPVEVKHLPPGLPFSPDLVGGIDQGDVDVVHRTMNTDGAPLGFRSDEPLCYAWIALQYFAINTGTLGWNYDVCGAPGNLRYGYLPPETVTKIANRLRKYGAPSMLFLCANGALAQLGRKEIRERRRAGDEEFEEAERWANQLKSTLMELTSPPRPDEGDRVLVKAYRARRLLMAPGVLPRVAIPRAAEALQLTEPLRNLIGRIDTIMDYVRRMQQEQEEILRLEGLRPGTMHADLLRRAFLAVRDLIPVARSGRGRPRSEVNELFGLWGVEVKKDTLNRWIREEGSVGR